MRQEGVKMGVKMGVFWGFFGGVSLNIWALI